MKWKKILISSSIGVACAAPIIAMAVIGANPRADKASTNFLMDFSNLLKDPSKAKNDYARKNGYINWIKDQVKEVFNEYSKINKKPKLTLDFRTLKTTMPPGELNYFTELNKALLGINENLSFNLIPRSPVSVQEGFYQRNSDMVSFYWSPDYNDIGTWLTYMFGDFQVANMWPALSAAINGTITPSNLTHNNSNTNWIDSLAERLTEIKIKYNNQEKQLVTKTNNAKGPKYKALNEKEIFDLLNNGVAIDEINTAIGNIISSWISSNESIQWKGTLSQNPTKQDGFYNEKGGFDGEFVPSMQTNFLDFVSSYNPNIPNYQDGPTTKTTFLVREGFHVPTNPNGTNNYRDWYSKTNTKNEYVEYMAGSPFAATVTSLNPCFTKASSATFFQTNFSTLFSWTSKHDFTSDATKPQDQGKFDVQLVSQGTTAPIKDFKNALESLMKGEQPSPQNGISGKVIDPANREFEIEIPIRPIPWVNPNGQIGDNPHYLSPIDFLVGIAAYKKSLELKLNSNNYFIKLIGLDIENTLKPLYENTNFDFLTNKSKNDNKKLKLHFKNPQLSSNNIADILSIQYFSALPHFAPKVKNILEIDSSKPFNPQGNDWDKYYATGYQTKAWRDCWYTTPYYINNITDQHWEMAINKEFFDMFETEKQQDDYVQFNMKPVIDKIQYKKIDKLKFYYNKSGFPEQKLFEMFKSGEADKSLIPSSSLTYVQSTESLRRQIYAPEVLKLAKSDLIPYNLQVYMKESNGVPIILDESGKKVEDKNLNNKLTVDEYGNLVFKPGFKPLLKSNIDAPYYDLIVKNFYTPIDAKGKDGKLLPALERSSAIIRSAINDCINWLSLSSIVNPSQSKTMQNSFLPYGVAPIPTNNGNGQVELAEDRLKYWSLSAYKLTSKDQDIGLRMGGILEWSVLDYFNVWESSIIKKK